jgi:hypothetical protein
MVRQRPAGNGRRDVGPTPHRATTTAAATWNEHQLTRPAIVQAHHEGIPGFHSIGSLRPFGIEHRAIKHDDHCISGDGPSRTRTPIGAGGMWRVLAKRLPARSQGRPPSGLTSGAAETDAAVGAGSASRQPARRKAPESDALPTDCEAENEEPTSELAVPAPPPYRPTDIPTTDIPTTDIPTTDLPTTDKNAEGSRERFRRQQDEASRRRIRLRD